MVEIFSSIQGEGILVGLRQIFLRFHACNLACAYCDTNTIKDSGVPEVCNIERTPGRRDFFEIKNPVQFDQIHSFLAGWQKHWPDIHHSISITGGEPLMHADVLESWLPTLRIKLPIYLETNGVIHDSLAKMIHLLDYIGMDIKLPSTSGHTELWEKHQQFIQIAANKAVFVKVIVGEETEEWEIEKTCEIIGSASNDIPLILQPKTIQGQTLGISCTKTLRLQELAATFLNEVRVIPQVHVFSGYL